MKSRQGFTLIEIIASMAVGAIALGLCAGLIHSLLKLERSGRDQSSAATALMRLERDFRTVVHAATAGEILEPEGEGAGPARLRLSLPDDVVIDFETIQGGITRLRRSQGDRLQREIYRIDSEAFIHWEIEQQGRHEVIILELVSGNRKQALPIRLEAILGYHDRYQSTE